MIFAMSDFHGCIEAFEKRVEQLKPYLDKGDKLLLLGDFIDRGPDSCGCLMLAKKLQEEYGKDQIIATKGNHEVWFIDFLKGLGDDWLAEDERFGTSKTFLTAEQYEELVTITSRDERLDFIKKNIRQNHRDLVAWMCKLPLYYETPTQIFTHAGVDEDIPEEEIDYCTLGTSDYIFTGKYPPTIGKFYKDVIAGHVAASHIAKNPYLKGAYFDGYSHYYIDGTVNKYKRLLCLAYDEKEGKYYDFLEDGSMEPIRKPMKFE